MSGKIVLHDAAGFAKMRKAGKLAAETLDYITPYMKAGAKTKDIDDLIHDFIVSHDAVPATLGYRGYPKSSCISINHVICHGIPGDKVLMTGDIANVDVTVILDGWFGDTSRMYEIGNVGVKAKKLVQVTYDAMMKGIEAVKPGATLGDIGYVIQKYVESNRYSVVRDFCGHGVGTAFHTEPNVLHYGRKGEGVELKEGMIFTIEPMVNIGGPDCKILEDGWTAVTRDRSLSAQFEHTVGVTSSGVEIFTLSPKGLDKPPYVL
ncbi:MAG: type I methionyl aminopeptidase [Alphaproteobacteria bacterium]|nr:type I methionyl aminopeptidase [Alphaproteobacteria bacterium]